MQINNRVLFHVLYFLFAIGVESIAGNMLPPVIGTLLTVIVLILLLAGLAVVYVMLFWGWRYEKDNKVEDFFADILTYIIDKIIA